MREKLRLRLTKRKEEQPKREEQQPVIERDGGVEDHRRVEDLLQFINSADSKPASSSKAAKRARHKQKKVTAADQARGLFEMNTQPPVFILFVKTTFLEYLEIHVYIFF